MRKVAVLLSFVLICSCLDSNRNLEQITLRGSTMGTSYNIKIIVSRTAGIDQNQLHETVKQELQNINQLVSTYIEDSELSGFNQFGETEWFPVSKDLVDIMATAIDISRKSGGAFDITVGPLVNLWGFGPEHQRDEIPDAREIERRKTKVGYQLITVREDPPALYKTRSDVYCDLSAIAKGWGVDVIAQLLQSKKFHHYLVEIGGEVRARGYNFKGKPWQIGVSSPDEQFGIQRVIPLKDLSVATSGDYRNYFEKGGVRYSHTIDPRTGRPITHNLVSVTVLHESCMIADAYATAIDVLGYQEGLQLAERENLAVLMITKQDSGFVETTSTRFETRIPN